MKYLLTIITIMLCSSCTGIPFGESLRERENRLCPIKCKSLGYSNGISHMRRWNTCTCFTPQAHIVPLDVLLD